MSARGAIGSPDRIPDMDPLYSDNFASVKQIHQLTRPATAIRLPRPVVPTVPPGRVRVVAG